jgi:dTDP-4-amino-4,6-dideoxygalactose transaminase
MTTGSGGMLVTNSKEIYERCRLFWRDGLSTSTSDRLKTGGRKHDYRVLAFSGGYDGNDISASIGRVQLKKLPEFTRRRNEIVKRYNSELGQSWTGNHLWPYFVQSEQEVHDLIAFMDAKGIKCGYHYPGTGWLGVSLPIYPLLTDKEVEYIIKCVKEWK